MTLQSREPILKLAIIFFTAGRAVALEMVLTSVFGGLKLIRVSSLDHVESN